jgi:hypothetical protein
VVEGPRQENRVIEGGLMSMFSTQSRGGRNRFGFSAFVGGVLVVGAAALPGCGNSTAGHVADSAAAAKTLIGDNPTSAPVKKTSNKRLQKLIDQEQQEIQKHPKIR